MREYRKVKWKNKIKIIKKKTKKTKKRRIKYKMKN
jgi:hypothetical protein